MNLKLIAMGNVLMKDDGIGIFITRAMEEELIGKGVEVIFGETDFGYCISKVNDSDTVIILDAASYGKNPGELSIIPLNNYTPNRNGYTQHGYNLLDILKLYYPNLEGDILAIEVKDITFGFGLTQELQKKKKDIIREIFTYINLLQEEREAFT
ncbi:MAG: hydrogenase maturation protease [Anaerocolumna sp.]